MSQSPPLTSSALLVKIQELMLPLLLGVVAALLVANLFPETYAAILHLAPFGEGAELHGHTVDLKFLIDDVFMVLFFGIAAKEIAHSALPGGSLNPPSKALTPLLATVGGVLVPVIVYFAAGYALYRFGAFDELLRIYASERSPEAPEPSFGVIAIGWGIPTATDIALAWLVARQVFGRGRAPVKFLLLLAVGDDAIGLVIIAVVYPDPALPVQPLWLLLVGAGALVSWWLRRRGERRWWLYVLIGGPLAWIGLFNAHVHPALALCVVVPFLPGPSPRTLADEDNPVEQLVGDPHRHSPLDDFEHTLKPFVDFGLFFFAFANAGVQVSSCGWLSLLIAGSLIGGKLIGVPIFVFGARLMGLRLPDGMGLREVVLAAYIAGLGLTVALFVATQAYPVRIFGPELQGEAKMGALLTMLVGLTAIPLARAIGVRKLSSDESPSANPSTRSARAEGPAVVEGSKT